MSTRFSALGDNALIFKATDSISPEVNMYLRKLSRRIETAAIKGVLEIVPSYNALTIYYDPCSIKFFDLVRHVRRFASKTRSDKVHSQSKIEIPVCYGGEYGPDLEFVAEHCRLPAEDIIKIHSGTRYLVYMLGFSPGFPYLGGMDERIACPRLESPRLKVLPGSVGIGGKQTGIYSMETPGGWRIIGRTPLKLFDVGRKQPFLLSSGDTIIFRKITESEYNSMAGGR